jgi:hypothetical protein
MTSFAVSWKVPVTCSESETESVAGIARPAAGSRLFSTSRLPGP